MCELFEQKVFGVIGPSAPESAEAVRKICDQKEIPLIETYNDGSTKHQINLFPSPDDLSRACLFLVEQYGWEDFVVLFKDIQW